MPFRSARNARFPLWLALVAMLALALLPSISHALAYARGGAAWAEVCTPQGMRLVAVDAAQAADTGAPVQAAGHLEHCPLCALGGDAPPLPPAPAAAVPLPLAGAEPPSLLPASAAHAVRLAQRAARAARRLLSPEHTRSGLKPLAAAGRHPFIGPPPRGPGEIP